MPRTEEIPAGTTRNLVFNTTYSSDWSEEASQEEDVGSSAVSSAKFMLKREIETADANAAYTESNPTIADGSVTVTIAATDTATLEGRYYGTLRLYMVDGGVHDWEDTTYPKVPYIYVDITQGAVKSTS